MSVRLCKCPLKKSCQPSKSMLFFSSTSPFLIINFPWHFRQLFKKIDLQKVFLRHFKVHLSENLSSLLQLDLNCLHKNLFKSAILAAKPFIAFYSSQTQKKKAFQFTVSFSRPWIEQIPIDEDWLTHLWCINCVIELSIFTSIVSAKKILCMLINRHQCWYLWGA